MRTTIPIGLSAWIIQDGNYPDFKVGEQCAFALEFYAQDPLRILNMNVPNTQYKHITDAQFEIVGKSIFSADDWWAMDFGIPAYTSHPPVLSHKAGTYLEGSIYLRVDHYPYFEYLARTENAPALIFDWKVEQIELQTAPFIQGEGMLIRDSKQLGWRDLQETNAWEDDGGHAEYLLHCTKISEQPRHTLKR